MNGTDESTNLVTGFNPEWLERWVNIVQCTEEASWENSKRRIAELYRLAGFKPPRRYLQVQSPLVLALAAPILGYILSELMKPTEKAVNYTVLASWYEVALSPVPRPAFWRTARGSVEKSNWNAVRQTVRQSVSGAVKDAITPPIMNAVINSQWPSVPDKVKTAVWETIRLSLKPDQWESAQWLFRKFDPYPVIENNWDHFIAGSFWGSVQALECFYLESIGLDEGNKAFKAAWALRIAQSASGWWYPHQDFVMVSNRPTHIHLKNGRLHCADGLAIEWRDGWGIAAWRGTLIPNAWVTGQRPSAKALLQWDNIEQRRAGFELIGWDKLLTEPNAWTINKHSNPQIGELLEVNLQNGRERFLKVICGTGREFVITAPPIAIPPGSPGMVLRSGAK